jgi:hypothetical protein
MNRFDDAVLDLLSSVPPATTVDGLRARIRRHRRRRAIAIVAAAGVISVTSVGVAAAPGHKTSAPLIAIAVSPTDRTSTTVAVPRVSCPPMSRPDAIRRAKNMPGTPATSPERAKLMTWAELHAHVSDAPSPLLTATTQVWVVEVRDWYFHYEPGPAADQPKPYPWAIFIIDAHTGAPYGPVTGPGNSSPYWDLLPDHSNTCAPNTVAPQAAGTRQVSLDGVSFDYPTRFHFDPITTNEHYITIIGYVSNQQVHQPCTTTNGPSGGISTQCGMPLTHMTPGGVLVVWSLAVPPGGSGNLVSAMPGTPRIVGGHAARVNITSAGAALNTACVGIGGVRTIEAHLVIKAGGDGDSTLNMLACLDRNALAEQSAVLAMLDSVRFTGQP